VIVAKSRGKGIGSAGTKREGGGEQCARFKQNESKVECNFCSLVKMKSTAKEDDSWQGTLQGG